MTSRARFLGLGRSFFLKELEYPAVYDTSSDELYQVDANGLRELARADGSLDRADARFPREFLDFCLEEGVLVAGDSPWSREVTVGRNERPSLRYLMIEITRKCNLSCRHCYLGESSGIDMSVKTLEKVLDEFEQMGGLRLIVTGGEPLLHPEFEKISSLCAGRSFRTILVTNGTLIDERTARALEFQEVQISIDGTEAGHDFMRGKGCFKEALRGLENLKYAESDVSVATMVHQRNIEELDALETLVRSFGAVSWTLDVPCESGRLADGADTVMPDLAEAAREMDRAFGSEQHEPSGDHACGAHLALVKPDGDMVKCGFYEDVSGGSIERGLREAWLRLPRMRICELDCYCDHLQECGGGCRFRAETHFGRNGPDPLKCIQFGVSPPGRGAS